MLPDRDRICSVVNCDRSAHARGLCMNHYQQLYQKHRRAGLPLPERICTVEDCDRLAKSRGLCKMHYSRLIRHGTPASPPTVVERFWSHVIRTDTCWLWTGGGVGWNGYARVKVEGKRIFVHRFSWSLANGPIPTGKVICHRCDVPLCVNPEHLFIGTQSDNIRDCVAKGRHPRQRAQAQDGA